jgi:voltage-gated sodium channel
MLKKLFLNDKVIIVIIALNALVIFLEGFEQTEIVSSWLDLFDNLFTLVFLLELIVKLNHYRPNKYFSDAWNLFDFSLVVLALPALMAWVFGFNFIQLDFLLVFRILRVFKFFRFIRFVPKIDHILNGVIRASKASVVIIMAFFIFNFIVSLISCFLFRDYSQEYFADPIISFYSIFKIFTVEGWYEIPDSIAENSSSAFAFFTRVYFIIILLFGGIFGLSLVNSIFVDSMISDNNDEIESQIENIDKKIDALANEIKSLKK